MRVTHEDRPLAGVTVKLTRNDGTKIVEMFSRETDASGTVRVSVLPAGDYWLDSELLGISAGSWCFHVSTRSSSGAKRKINLQWGDEAPAAREAAGRLVHREAGHSDDPFWNRLHPVEAPISGGAHLSLRTPHSEATYTATLGHDGHFDFGEVPDGIYVLRVEEASREPANLLFRVSHTAKHNSLFVDDADAIAGSCGGWSIEPDYMAGL